MKNLFLMSIITSMTLFISACNGGGVLSLLEEEIDKVMNKKRINKQVENLKNIDENMCFIINELVDVKNGLESAREGLEQAREQKKGKMRKEAKDKARKQLNNGKEKINKLRKVKELSMDDCMYSLKKVRR